MKRALLINDSKFESLVLKDLLQKLNFDVEIADEFDALYQAHKFLPDVVIANYIMQQTTGDQLIKNIKEKDKRIKCLLSSNGRVRLKDFSDSNVDGILRTPVSFYVLKDLLNRVGLNEIDRLHQEVLVEEVVDNSEKKHRIYCPSCNKDLTFFGDDVTFCPFCGDELIRE